MTKKILLTIVGLVSALLVFTATRPSEFSVQRSAVMKAKPEKIYIQIHDFHNWTAWSPWEKKDPEMKRTYSGEKSGKGAAYSWEANKDVGSGSMIITESVSPTRVALNLDFSKPFEAHNKIVFSITSEKDSSTLTWVMNGKNNFLGKFFSIFFSMDKMVGKDFETGLANLKTIVEK